MYNKRAVDACVLETALRGDSHVADLLPLLVDIAFAHVLPAHRHQEAVDTSPDASLESCALPVTGTCADAWCASQASGEMCRHQGRRRTGMELSPSSSAMQEARLI